MERAHNRMKRAHNQMSRAHNQMKRTHNQTKRAHKDDCGTNYGTNINSILCEKHIIDVNVKQHGTENRSLWNSLK